MSVKAPALVALQRARARRQRGSGRAACTQQEEDMACCAFGDADTAMLCASPPAHRRAAEQRHARVPQGGAGCDGRGDDRWRDEE
jgi:hypothetical protein